MVFMELARGFMKRYKQIALRQENDSYGVSVPMTDVDAWPESSRSLQLLAAPYLMPVSPKQSMSGAQGSHTGTHMPLSLRLPLTRNIM